MFVCVLGHALTGGSLTQGWKRSRCCLLYKVPETSSKFTKCLHKI